LLKPYRTDESGMCYLITVLVPGRARPALLAQGLARPVRWAGNAARLSRHGRATVLGLIMTVSSLSADNAHSLKAIVDRDLCRAPAPRFYTNLLACIG